jgi:phospholipase/carboxylesterase
LAVGAAVALVAAGMITRGEVVPRQGSTPQPSPSPAAQERQRQVRAAFARAYEARDWPAAIASGEQLVALAPADGRAAYSLACVYALDGQRDAAVAWLQRAVGRRFSALDVFDADPDLASLRGDARLASVREEVARNRDALMAEVREHIAQAPVAFHVSPPAYERGTARSPLLVALHGFGSSAAEMVPAFEYFADASGAVLALPQGPTATGEGFDWVSADHADAVVTRTLEVARQRYPYDRRQVVLAGFSQGAGMALRVALRHPEVFRGVVAIAGRYDPILVPGTKVDPKARRLRVMLMVGAEDGAAENNRETERRLEAAKFDVRLRVYPKLGHRLPPNAVVEFTDAFNWVVR